MKAEYINPFLEESMKIFKEMGQVDLKPMGTTVKNTPLATKNVVIMVSVTGDLIGSVAINLDADFAKQIASNMMYGMEVTELNEMSMSALKELANIIMGRVATAFSQKGLIINIAPPNLMIGENMKLSVAFIPLLSIKFNCNKYDLDFDISIKENIK